MHNYASGCVYIYIVSKVPIGHCNDVLQAFDSKATLLGIVLSLEKQVQQHHHTVTLKKATNRGTNVKDCQFDFPMHCFLSVVTKLKNNDDPGNKSRFYVLKKTAWEENCNP